MEIPDNYLRLCIQCNQLKKFKHSGGRVTGKKCMACYSKKSNLKTNTEKPEYFKSYYENHKDVIKAQAKRNYLKKKNRGAVQLQLLETNDSDETFENLQAEQTFNMDHIVDIEEEIRLYTLERDKANDWINKDIELHNIRMDMECDKMFNDAVLSYIADELGIDV